jgi:hypothetical protein
MQAAALSMMLLAGVCGDPCYDTCTNCPGHRTTVCQAFRDFFGRVAPPCDTLLHDNYWPLDYPPFENSAHEGYCPDHYRATYKYPWAANCFKPTAVPTQKPDVSHPVDSPHPVLPSPASGAAINPADDEDDAVDTSGRRSVMARAKTSTTLR